MWQQLAQSLAAAAASTAAPKLEPSATGWKSSRCVSSCARDPATQHRRMSAITADIQLPCKDSHDTSRRIRRCGCATCISTFLSGPVGQCCLPAAWHPTNRTARHTSARCYPPKASPRYCVRYLRQLVHLRKTPPSTATTRRRGAWNQS